MFPVAFEIPLPGGDSLPVQWYGLLTLAGIFAALWVARGELARLALLTPRQATDAVLLTAMSGFVGGHLLFLATPGRPVAGWRTGSVLYGAIFGSALAVVLIARYHRLHPGDALDVAAPAGVLPPLMGRLGCFTAGCCYGRPTELPLGVAFTDPACSVPAELRGVPLHPTQLYEAGALLALFGLLQWRRRHKAFRGELALLYAILYSIARFAIESLRGDGIRGFVAGGALSFSQAIALATLAIAGPLYAMLRLRAAGR